jgi:hypothetical protein
MAEMVGALAGFVILLGIILNFSLHKLEEGHVGVYYRVSICIYSFGILYFDSIILCVLFMILLFIYPYC